MNTQELLWLLGSLAAIFRRPYDPDLLARQFPPPLAEDAFERAASAAGFVATSRTVPLRRLAKQSFPLVAKLKVVGEKSNEQQVSIILQADATRVLLVEPGDEAPRTLTREEFAQDLMRCARSGPSGGERQLQKEST